MDNSTYKFVKNVFLKETQRGVIPKELKEITVWLKNENFINTERSKCENNGYILKFMYDFGEDIMEVLNVSIVKNEYTNYKIEWRAGLDEPGYKSQKGNDLQELVIAILEIILDTIERSNFRKERKKKIETLIQKHGMNYKKYI